MYINICLYKKNIEVVDIQIVKMLRNIFGCLCIKKQYDIEGRRYVEHEVIGQG